jgi:oligopeptide/dipeptide ABC transporter ATP-binding protein
MSDSNILSVKDLSTSFFLSNGILKALDSISFDIKKGETLGIVGESGCGKSMTALSIMGLVPNPPGRIVGGEILFEGKNLRNLSEKQMRSVRGNDIAMIFQEPMTSLNPVFTVGHQIMESIILHQNVTKTEAKAKAIEMLELVKMPLAKERIYEYPHQLSGGMRQRVMIAIALACNPKLLICDEPTTALDVTVQAQIITLINQLRKKLNMSVMMITHDMGVINKSADRVMVMYAGKIVELSSVKEIFNEPKHPYTEALLKSIPKINNPKDELYTIEGMVPDLMSPNPGCLFADRCDYAKELCRTNSPDLVEIGNTKVRCHKYTSEWGK